MTHRALYWAPANGRCRVVQRGRVEAGGALHPPMHSRGAPEVRSDRTRDRLARPRGRAVLDRHRHRSRRNPPSGVGTLARGRREELRLRRALEVPNLDRSVNWAGRRPIQYGCVGNRPRMSFRPRGDPRRGRCSTPNPRDRRLSHGSEDAG